MKRTLHLNTGFNLIQSSKILKNALFVAMSKHFQIAYAKDLV